VPDLEHVAHADERGGYAALIPKAVAIDGLPRVNVHAFRYEAGRQKIEMIGKGSYVILGVVKAEAGAAGKPTRLRVLREHPGPVIGPEHPDVKDNRSGFETGRPRRAVALKRFRCGVRHAGAAWDRP
jgi:hypothetical protein